MTSPSEIALPFAIDPVGNVAHTEIVAQQLINHVAMIVGTELYSRPMSPLYGVDVDAYLFDNNDLVSQGALIADLTVAIQDNEPLVDVSDISIAPVDPDDPSTMAIQISFTIVTAQSAATGTVTTPTYVATVMTNGTVVGFV